MPLFFFVIEFQARYSAKQFQIMQSTRNRFSESLRISVVSSAYWLILISLPLIKIPSICLFILSANISTQSKKM